ncbi:NfeD family protein [Clostridium sp. CX1]|uniref:NfeD family protein n=1 Tax=Clostridium tanneri TaxID=3037988 RepID=A0ABU4JV44_9CLOT|nr:MULTISPECIES: NfeD family protein [unclassified Clostridium]MCT8978018.1 NfeD family protein [Clostridium sp. CX1]MDW8802029.1 NfeD family protein [Clostridium sp. A1-XYC3]
MISSIILWLIVGGAALAIDIATSSFLFVWFTVGAIAAIIMQTLDFSFIAQLITFIVVSGISMAVGYPIARRTIKSSVKRTPVREETYVGKILTVDEDILEEGKIRVDGVYWQAVNDGETIEKGDQVKITEVKGNRIIIKKI